MLEDVTAVVTGASQGIGREIAITMADHGANVVLAARSDGIYETEDEIESRATLAVEVDVTDEDSVVDGIEAAVDEFGGIDCLVNNAGIAGPTAPIEEVTLEEWRETMSVNVDGMFLMTKYAAPHLRESDRGSVINLSSISGKRPLRNRTPYTASKMAVIGLTRTLAVEFGDDDVTVNAICPGATKGPRIDSVIEEQADSLDVSFEEAKAQLFTDEAALGKLVDASDIADAASFLASENARSITAQDLNVDGGTVWY
ncbi:SDR family NAD(P)-dependent oxidoreductase [Natrinema ejinorense]|uniref:Short-chain dehydrogenase n=1 Tax=Natrinema ejinorense TaxID=373386 RepID=A0A2A5QQ18_9EURY|nr:SDR family NAD(P)-dependent oxidoreductase [Natrinema ejinorense]PCR88875.1 short-chain dehydrogenase [Natrinema ejinorense]